MKKVFEYLDYRDYLSDFYDCQKERNYFYSYRFMAAKLDIDHSLLVKILSGKRHITEKHVKPLVSLCKLAGREALYFETLVEFCKSKSDRQSKILFEKMLNLKSHQSRTLEHYQYEYFKAWYYAATRSLLDYYEFDGDYAALAEKLNPSITVSQAKKTIEVLDNLGLIKKDEQGVYRPTDKHVSTGEKWRSVVISDYQRETIQMSAWSIERDPRETRDISSVTMSVDKECFDDIILMLNECRSSIIKRVNEIPDGRRDRVYQLNMQFIPLSRIEGGMK